MENSVGTFGENGENGMQGNCRSIASNSVSRSPPPLKNLRGSPSRNQRKKSATVSALLSLSQSSENMSLDGSFNKSSSSSGHANNLRIQSITHKKALIAAARRVNPSMTNSAPAVFWSTEECLKYAAIDTTGAQQQLNIVENGVNSTAKRY